MKVIYRALALDEATAAKIWNRQFELDDQFVEDLEHAIDLVSRFNEIGRRVNSRGARRILLRQLPYVLYYRVRGNTLVVLAVLHTAQDPRRLRGRLH